ncbi:rhodanese-like domain-containing protein [Neobacillus sp. D3-1R]|uniref:rhodanese-like domain-containing protein n=1 Tax=Neobacillus sp. D3-1R TaxID=3445778 RepID=UPI003FA16892
MKWLKYVLLFVFLTGCTNTTYENITSMEAKEFIQKGEVTVLDVRTPEEYASGHIPGSKLVPLQVLDGMSNELDKNTKYIIVCHSGNRSQQASDILVQKGFKQILNMTGGMNSWNGEIEQ